MQFATPTAAPAFLATPTRLRSGNWGARVTLGSATRAPAKGDRVQVRTAAGKTWDACVKRVVWAGEGVWICATVAAPALDQTRRDPAVRSTPARRTSGAWMVVATDVETGTVHRMEMMEMDTEAQARSYAEALIEDGDGQIRYEVVCPALVDREVVAFERTWRAAGCRQTPTTDRAWAALSPAAKRAALDRQADDCDRRYVDRAG